MLLVYCTGKKIIITVSSYSLPFWDEEILFLHNNIHVLSKLLGFLSRERLLLVDHFQGRIEDFVIEGA